MEWHVTSGRGRWPTQSEEVVDDARRESHVTAQQLESLEDERAEGGQGTKEREGGGGSRATRHSSKGVLAENMGPRARPMALPTTCFYLISDASGQQRSTRLLLHFFQ